MLSEKDARYHDIFIVVQYQVIIRVSYCTCSPDGMDGDPSQPIAAS